MEPLGQIDATTGEVTWHAALTEELRTLHVVRGEDEEEDLSTETMPEAIEEEEAVRPLEEVSEIEEEVARRQEVGQGDPN